MANSQGTEEVVNHYGMVRLRITGSGSFRMTLYSLDEIKSNTLATLSLSATTHREPDRLSNFTQQRASLDGRVIAIDEWFEISKIIIFAKPVAKSFPMA